MVNQQQQLPIFSNQHFERVAKRSTTEDAQASETGVPKKEISASSAHAAVALLCFETHS